MSLERFNKTVVATLLCIAVGAIVANTAHANWFVNGTELGAAAERELSISATSTFTLKGTILGRATVLHATGLTCATGGTTCSIRGSSFGTNNSMGRLKFTGVTVEKPAECEVPGGILTTNNLEGQVAMRTVAGSTNTYDRLLPVAPGKVFAEVPLAGAECTLAGTLTPVEGALFDETEETGKELATQPVRFNANSNSISALELGGSPATLEGSASTALVGGGEFGVAK